MSGHALTLATNTCPRWQNCVKLCFGQKRIKNVVAITSCRSIIHSTFVSLDGYRFPCVKRVQIHVYSKRRIPRTCRARVPSVFLSLSHCRIPLCWLCVFLSVFFCFVANELFCCFSTMPRRNQRGSLRKEIKNKLPRRMCSSLLLQCLHAYCFFVFVYQSMIEQTKGSRPRKCTTRNAVATKLALVTAVNALFLKFFMCCYFVYNIGWILDVYVSCCCWYCGYFRTTQSHNAVSLRDNANIELDFVLEKKNAKHLQKFLRDKQPIIGIALAEVCELWACVITTANPSVPLHFGYIIAITSLNPALGEGCSKQYRMRCLPWQYRSLCRPFV